MGAQKRSIVGQNRTIPNRESGGQKWRGPDLEKKKDLFFSTFFHFFHFSETKLMKFHEKATTVKSTGFVVKSSEEDFERFSIVGILI